MPIGDYTSKRKSNNWVRTVKHGSTAGDVLDIMIAACEKDKDRKTKRGIYTMREFSREESVDIGGAEVHSPSFAISHIDLDSLRLHIARKGKSVKLYQQYCATIERTISTPNLPSFIKIEGFPKVKTIEQIKERLDKYLRREKFELKTLREICPDIQSTQNRNTKAAIVTLKFMHNDGNGRDQGALANALYEGIYDREKDKLFYITRHPKQGILHRCNDEAILERISHLMWVFVDGNPFKETEVPGAISRLI